MFGFKKKTPVEEPATQEPQSKPKPAAAIQPEALGTGFAAKAGKALKNRAAQIDEAAGYANGGMVRGKGTGTSDSIETEVPQGSYIMPADSTEKLGEQTVAGMGAPTPVNLSNGEYQLPPEQVHAVGVQALDQVKNATHTQVPTQGGETQGLGFQPASQKPELFLANGGVVDDEEKRRQSTLEATGSGTLGVGKIAAGMMGAIPGAFADFGNDIGYSALGADKTGIPSYMGKSLDLAKQGFSDISQAGEDVRANARDALGLKAAAPAVQPNPAPAVQAKPAAMPYLDPNVQPANSAPNVAASIPATPATQQRPALDQNQSDNNVTRIGNSFSGANIREGYTVNGAAPARGAPRSPQNQNAVDNLAASTPSVGAGNAPQMPEGFKPGAGLMVIQDGSAAETARRNLMLKLSDKNLTASQRSQMLSLQESGDRNALTASTNAQNNDASLTEAGMQAQSAAQLAAMQDKSAFERASLQEDGANRRADASNRIDQQKVDGESEARGFQSRALARQEKLYQQYESAKPEERAAIAQQIRDLSGKADPQQNLRENFMTRKAPVTDAKGNVVGERDEIVDLRTGQPIGQQTNSAPKAGEQRGGYRFKGGNPADQKNWERI